MTVRLEMFVGYPGIWPMSRAQALPHIDRVAHRVFEREYPFGNEEPC